MGKGEVCMSIFVQVSEAIAERLCVEPAQITMESKLKDDLGADSLDIPEIVMELEEIFGITVPDEEIGTLQTVRDIVEYVEAHIAD